LLGFEAGIDGILVNGVDIIEWNEAGTIAAFKVMVRPPQAITVVHERMARMLASAQPLQRRPIPGSESRSWVSSGVTSIGTNRVGSGLCDRRHLVVGGAPVSTGSTPPTPVCLQARWLWRNWR